MRGSLKIVAGIGLALAVSGGVFGATRLEREGDAYRCFPVGDGPAIEAKARYGILTGELRAYSGLDTNGLPLRIEPKNSSRFECSSLKSLEDAESRRMADCRTLLAKEPAAAADGGVVPWDFERSSCEALLQDDTAH